MAITTQDGLVAAMANAQDVTIMKQSITTTANSWASLWAAAGNPGAGSLTVGNTTNGVVPTDATTGTPVINAFTGSNTGYLTGFDANNTVQSAVRVYDRLFHVGSIATTTLATTTLSSVPLFSSRTPAGNANGLGLELWLEVNVAVSSTATTVTVSYTNPGGTTGRTATLDTTISGLISGRMLPFRLQAGDTGVKSIESITVGGTVGTAGSFNVLITRTLAEHNVMASGIAEDRQDPYKTGLPQVYTDSALALMILTSGTASGLLAADVDVANG